MNNINNTNKEKGFAVPMIIAILVLITLGGVFYFNNVRHDDSHLDESNEVFNQNNTDSVSDLQEQIEVSDQAENNIPNENEITSEPKTITTPTLQNDVGKSRWSNEAPTKLKWGPKGIITGAQSLTNGRANTATLAALGPEYEAATYCANLTEGGFSDWYLPAIEELWTEWEKHGSIVFTSYYYWSSTEYADIPEYFAWYLYTDYGFMHFNNKDYAGSVRCLR